MGTVMEARKQEASDVATQTTDDAADVAQLLERTQQLEESVEALRTQNRNYVPAQHGMPLLHWCLISLVSGLCVLLLAVRLVVHKRSQVNLPTAQVVNPDVVMAHPMPVADSDVHPASHGVAEDDGTTSPSLSTPAVGQPVVSSAANAADVPSKDTEASPMESCATGLVVPCEWRSQVDQLRSMGFELDHCKAALCMFNGDIAAAVQHLALCNDRSDTEWTTIGEDDVQEDGTETKVEPTRVHECTPEPAQEAINPIALEELVDMGFAESDALEALAVTSDDMKATIKLLVDRERAGGSAFSTSQHK